MQVLDLSVKWLAEALKAAESQGMPQIAGAIARVLPHLAHSSPTAQAALLDHFVLSLDLSALDVAGASASEIQVGWTAPAMRRVLMFIDGMRYHTLQRLTGSEKISALHDDLA